LFSTFCLDAKGEAKKSRKIQMLRWIFQAHAQQPLRTICIRHVLITLLQVFLQELTFSKAHSSSELKCNKRQALYPALLFLKNNVHMFTRDKARSYSGLQLL
jgi:hypothetical protein